MQSVSQRGSTRLSKGKTTAWQILNSFAIIAFAIQFFAIPNTGSQLAFRAIISPPVVLWK
jgi:hypothetical protein